MTRNKYRVFLDYLCVFLALLPVISFLLIQFRNPIVTGDELNQYFATANGWWTINTDLRIMIQNAFRVFGWAFNSNIGYLMFCCMSNAVVIYIARFFVEVLVFLPKLFLKWMEDKS